MGFKTHSLLPAVNSDIFVRSPFLFSGTNWKLKTFPFRAWKFPASPCWTWPFEIPDVKCQNSVRFRHRCPIATKASD